MDSEPTGSILRGIGGVGESVIVKTVVILTRDDGGEVFMRGEFAAFTDRSSTDISILGRDVLNHFDLILSRRRQRGLAAGCQSSISCRTSLTSATTVAAIPSENLALPTASEMGPAV